MTPNRSRPAANGTAKGESEATASLASAAGTYQAGLARLRMAPSNQAVRDMLDHAAHTPDWWPHMAQRFIQDLIVEATPAVWLRRADDMEAARPRPTDWPGHATPEQLAELDRRNAATAAECRIHAAILAGIPTLTIAASDDYQPTTLGGVTPDECAA